MEGLNPNYKPKKKKELTKEELIATVAEDRYVLSQLITLLESNDPVKKSMGIDVLKSLKTKDAPKAIRIGITGSPGVGKSTFINAFATYLVKQGSKVAVLAIDPSSLPTKGSILGDKTRMVDLTTLEDVYSRPTSAGELLGGVAMGTREAIEACELAGYSHILIETVGVGQSEHLASQMVDMTLLLLQVAAGDDLQGIKRGIMEMGDVFILNKEDIDEDGGLVQQSMSFYRNALSFLHKRLDVKYPRVLSCSALHQTGMDKVHQSVSIISQYLRSSGQLESYRAAQDKIWLEVMMREYIVKRTFDRFTRNISHKIDKDDYFLDKFEAFKKALDTRMDKLAD